MLRWLHNIVPKRFHLLSKLCLFVSGTHLLLLCFLFVGYKSQQAYALEIAKQLQITADTKIMFMPLYQTTQGLAKKSGSGGVRGGSPKLASAARTRVKERPATSLVSAPPKIKSKKKGAGLDAKAKNKAALEKKKKLERKKELEKKKKEALKKEPEKPEEKKEAEKKDEKKEPEKSEEKKVTPELEQKPDANEQKTSDAKVGEQAGAAEKSGDAGQDVVYVGQQEYDALGMQTYLQQELSANWQPPQGLPADTSCEISFVVDWHGKANTVAVSKSSGALVYDISARSALLAMEFPDWARGKAFKITFKQ